MSSIGTGYDLSASTFSPDGRVFQVEYALKAVDSSGTAIALRGKNCVVVAVEKLITSKLYESTTNPRIMSIDQHIGLASSGLYPDARSLVTYAIDEAKNYFYQYRRKIECHQLADRLAYYMHAYTLYSMVRPFGCSIILASWDKIDGPQLFMTDPAGLNYGYFGCAIGKHRQAAKTEIEKLKLNEMTPEEMVKAAANIIYKVREEAKDKLWQLEMSWVGTHTDGAHQLVPENLRQEAEAEAQRALLEDDDEEEGDMREIASQAP